MLQHLLAGGFHKREGRLQMKRQAMGSDAPLDTVTFWPNLDLSLKPFMQIVSNVKSAEESAHCRVAHGYDDALKQVFLLQ